jgi:hypothetical protein
MKCREKILLTSILTFCSITSLVADCSVTPYFSPRSQGVDAARQMVGWQDLINQCNKECFYCAVAGVAEFTQTFRSSRLCECLFGTTNNNVTEGNQPANSCSSSCDDDCNDSCSDCSIAITGSCVANRGATDWMADYFGLPTNYSSTITFSPRVRNFIAEVQFFAGFSDCWYFRLNLPITYSKWALRACETLAETGNSNPYPAGYFSGQEVPRGQLVPEALDFFSGCAAPDLTTGQFPSVKFQPLRYSKWACGSLTKTRLADACAILGFNAICNDCGYLGFNARLTAPAGNKPNGEFLFEPIVGNGHHWGLGFGINAHYELWRSRCNNSTFGFYLDANFSHLFSSRQTRVFDLCAQGSNSRYMLAQKLGAATNLFGSPNPNVEITADGTRANLQFANEFAPVANLIAAKVNVQVSIEGEVAFKLAYKNNCGLSWDIGYDFWGRTCEKFSRTKCCQTDLSLWALKGDAYVYGFNNVLVEGTPIPVPLGASENDATINGGTGTGTPPSCNNNTNTGIDHSQFAFVNVSGNDLTPLTTVTNSAQVHTSIQPITLDTAAINYAANRGMSSKIFTHLNYSWTPCEDYTPFVGVGGFAEFGQSCKSDRCDTNCPVSCTPRAGCDDDAEGSCVTCALSQWAVWIKGGVLFN